MPLPTAPLEENPTKAPLSPPPSTRADFDVSRYLVDKSQIIGSRTERPFDEYGSHLSHEIGEHQFSPSRPQLPHEQASLHASPLHPSSPKGDHPLRSQEGGVQSQPDVTSSILLMSNAASDYTLTPRPSGAIRRNQALVSKEDTTVVMASTLGGVVINCSDISSCDSRKHVLGDSIDEDNDDDDDVGVEQGVSFLAGRESQVIIADPPVGPHPAPTSTVPTVDKFYNTAGKAPHSDAIMPKRESGWSMN